MNADFVTSFPYRRVPLFVMVIHAVGLCTCHVIGFIMHPNAMGKTECQHISNFWPTISDLQKDWLLIRYIYKTVVCLLIQLRIIDIFLYFKYFTHTPLHQQRMWYRVLNTINLMCAIALLYLYHTAFFVSLGDSATIHMTSWMVITVLSILQMVFFLVLCIFDELETKINKKLVIRLQAGFFLVHIASMFLFYYFVKKHLECQPYAHSVAAISEFVFAQSHIFFHGVDYLNFAGVKCILRYSSKS